MLHEGVIYRHIVLTVPEMLRKTFYQHADVLLSAFMRCGVRCLDDVFSRVSGKDLKGGYIVVIQTHGRNGHTTRICISLRPVADGIKRHSSGCIWTMCRMLYLLYVSTQLLWWQAVTGTIMVESGQLIAH